MNQAEINELKSIFKEVLIEYDQDKAKAQVQKLMSINQVAHRLHRSHSTVKKLVNTGILKATPDRRISEQAINEFLKNT